MPPKPSNLHKKRRCRKASTEKKGKEKEHQKNTCKRSFEKWHNAPAAVKLPPPKKIEAGDDTVQPDPFSIAPCCTPTQDTFHHRQSTTSVMHQGSTWLQSFEIRNRISYFKYTSAAPGCNDFLLFHDGSWEFFENGNQRNTMPGDQVQMKMATLTAPEIGQCGKCVLFIEPLF